jgi:hypothetical protein
LEAVRRDAGFRSGLGIHEASLDQMRQRQIHVVAAEHQMVADTDPCQFGLTVAQVDLDQAEVGKSGAHSNACHFSIREN